MTHPTIGSTVAHKVPMLHVHGQATPHDYVTIVGNEQGIRALAKACENALCSPCTQIIRAFTRDGDSCLVQVTAHTTAQMLVQPLPEYGD